jgi:hypothetical protein
MAADGQTALDPLFWGTSTSGAASSGETTSTLGVDRGDVQVPRDTTRLWNKQITQAKNLLIAISSTFKGGTRLGVLTQSSSPFGSTEQGLWCDVAGNPRWSFGGVANTLLAPAFANLGDLVTYTGSAVTVLSGSGVTNGWVLTFDNTQPGGIKWAAGGGASLGNYTFTGNNFDLNASGTGTVWGTNTTGLTIGGANMGSLFFSGTRFRITQNVQTATAAVSAMSIVGGAHTNLTASTEYNDINFALNRTVQLATGALTTERWIRIQPPTLGFVGASTVTNTALVWIDGAPKAGTNATLTNTAGLWVQTGADAAMGVVVQANSSTQSGSLFSSLDSSGNKLITVVPTSSGQSHTLGLTTLVNGGGSVMTWANSTLGTTTTFALGSGNQVLMGGDSWIFQDHLGNTTQLSINLNGISSNRIGPISSQTVAFSATPAFDPTAGNFIDFGPVTANVTGPTMVAGRAGEVCTIVMRKDATASAYTVSTSWGSNVRIDSTALAFTTGSGSLIVLTFRWDDRLSTPAWVEQSRKAFN